MEVRNSKCRPSPRLLRTYGEQWHRRTKCKLSLPTVVTKLNNKRKLSLPTMPTKLNNKRKLSLPTVPTKRNNKRKPNRIPLEVQLLRPRCRHSSKIVRMVHQFSNRRKLSSKPEWTAAPVSRCRTKLNPKLTEVVHSRLKAKPKLKRVIRQGRNRKCRCKISKVTSKPNSKPKLSRISVVDSRCKCRTRLSLENGDFQLKTKLKLSQAAQVSKCKCRINNKSTLRPGYATIRTRMNPIDLITTI